jgi:hypothetical protein
MNFAFYLVLITGILLQFCLAGFMFKNNVDWYIYLSIPFFTMGWLKIIWEYNTIIKKINPVNETEAIKVIKKNGMKVPEWLKIGAYTFLTPIVIYFLWNLFK